MLGMPSEYILFLVCIEIKFDMELDFYVYEFLEKKKQLQNGNLLSTSHFENFLVMYTRNVDYY